jgi:site-specific recombinase XerD
MEDASLRYGPAMDSSASSSLSRSFERHLRAKNLSAGTVASYLVGLRQFTTFLQPHGRELIQATRADLEAFIGDLLARWSPATASTRYKQLQALYRWLEDEEEIAVNPMARMKPPVVPDKPIPVVPEDALRRLLAACAGKSFEARRDTALVTFLIDTGARRGEIAGLRLADLDYSLATITCAHATQYAAGVTGDWLARMTCPAPVSCAWWRRCRGWGRCPCCACSC